MFFQYVEQFWVVVLEEVFYLLCQLVRLCSGERGFCRKVKYFRGMRLDLVDDVSAEEGGDSACVEVESLSVVKSSSFCVVFLEPVLEIVEGFV